MNPICGKCGIPMTCIKNGVVFQQKSSRNLWHGDRFACKKCGNEVVTNFGKEPETFAHDAAGLRTLEQVKAVYKSHGMLIEPAEPEPEPAVPAGWEVVS